LKGYQYTGLQCSPSAKDDEKHYTQHHTKRRPEEGQSVGLFLWTLGQVLHHPLRETIVFNLLLCSLLEEILD
jgi:hypothetical protein